VTKDLSLKALLGALLATHIAAAGAELEEPDSGLPWLTAILPLTVPVERLEQQHRRAMTDDCSATVIATQPARLLSAWHCFDGYNDLTKPPLVTTSEGPMALRLLATGGSMLADWALLAPADSRIDAMLSTLPSVAAAPLRSMPHAAVVMAGFSHVTGDRQRLLRADMHCQAIAADRHWVRSDCIAFKGASGGPVLQKVGDDWRIVGVISAKESSGTRLFTPIPQGLLNR